MSNGLSRRQKRMKTQAENDIRAVLAHPPSVRYIVRLLEGCGLWRDQFRGDDSSTNYALGQRKTGLTIVDQLQSVDPDAMLKLLQTAAEERRNNAPRKEEEESDED